ncbi:hypothetical protein ABW21_db0202851 [Orbilia brochopaga]|nr:hypothetical protein ABW21_db0202851 [Drechslerella brochopaga]
MMIKTRYLGSTVIAGLLCYDVFLRLLNYGRTRTWEDDAYQQSFELEQQRGPYNESKLAFLLENRALPHLTPLLLHFMGVVPPEWPFMFLGSNVSIAHIRKSPAIRQFEEVGKIRMSQISENVTITSQEDLSRLLTSREFYEALLPAEWLFFFQTDSIICANSPTTINDWVETGASWWGAPFTNLPYGGNGGLSLRRISHILRVLGAQRRLDQELHEDRWLADRLWHLPGSKMPTVLEQRPFSVEVIPWDTPMGYHTGWGGRLLMKQIWEHKEQRDKIFEYCPEIKMFMELITEPEVGDSFPFASSRAYTPNEAPLARLQTFLGNLHPNLTHPVLVALSVHGTDNRCILNALSDLSAQKPDSQPRAIVSIDPHTISDDELATMHAAGVRGARMNLKSSLAEPSAAEFERTLRAYADRLKPLKTWPLQIHLSLHQVPLIAETIPKLGITVIIDHLAAPSTREPLQPAREQLGYKEFMRLLSRGEIYTKLSGTDRFPNLPALHEYATEVVATASDRVVWASDWPHTGGVRMNPGGDRLRHQGFRAVNDHGLLQRAVEVYCKGDEDIVRRVWRDNARALWDYTGDD